jgi:hypothetical protein
MNRPLAVLSVSALFALAGCTGDNAGDANKTKATAETAKTADTAAPPTSAGTPSGTAAAETPPKTAPEPSGSAHAEGPGKEGHDDKAHEGGGDKADKVIHLPHAKLAFNHPGAGWVEAKKGPWTVFRPADKTSVLAFVEFDKPGEATARVGQIAENLELADVKWKGAPKKQKVGPDKLDAEFAEGSCKVATNKHDCELEYYTVDGSTLIVYAFETDVKKAGKHEKIATKTVETLRKEDGAGDKADKAPHGGHKKK